MTREKANHAHALIGNVEAFEFLLDKMANGFSPTQAIAAMSSEQYKKHETEIKGAFCRGIGDTVAAINKAIDQL